MHHARRFAALALAGAALAGCSSSGTTDPSALPPTSVDPAAASAAGDPLTEAAIRKNASFTCPAAAGQAGAGATPVPAGKRLTVATTVAPITSIVANVAGDKADVQGVIPEGEDSHTYEPKPSVAALFAKADVVIVNGLDLEDPTKDLARANVPKTTQVVELGSLTIAPEQYIFDFSFPRDGKKPNPHLWTNPPMAACYATIAESVLSRADPTNAGTYAANAAAYRDRLNDLDRRFRKASEALPKADRALLTYHDAYAYFAAWYGWRVIGAIQVSSFEDPTPKEVADLVKQVKEQKVRAIFGSEVFPSKVLESIGKEAGVPYVDKLRDDDLPGAPGDADHSFLALLKADFVTMVKALGGDATDLEAFDARDVAKDGATYPQ